MNTGGRGGGGGAKLDNTRASSNISRYPHGKMRQISRFFEISWEDSKGTSDCTVPRSSLYVWVVLDGHEDESYLASADRRTIPPILRPVALLARTVGCVLECGDSRWVRGRVEFSLFSLLTSLVLTSRAVVHVPSSVLCFLLRPVACYTTRANLTTELSTDSHVSSPQTNRAVIRASYSSPNQRDDAHLPNGLEEFFSR